MKKRCIAFVLALALSLSLCTVAGAADYTTEQLRAAEALHYLGLFRGVSSESKDFRLERSLTRAEGTTLLVRVIGKENEALMLDESENIFSDMAGFAWAIPYIAYGEKNGLVYGGGNSSETGKPVFRPQLEMTDYMYLTIMLRQLGYSEAEDGFVWNDPYALASSVNLIYSTAPDKEFTRGDAALVSWNAMSIEYKGTNETVADRLIAEGVFTAEQYNDAIEIWTYGHLLEKEDASESDPGSTGDSPEDEPDDNDTTEDTPPAEDDNDTDVTGDIFFD